MREYLLTYLWSGMECFAAVVMYDAFSARKFKAGLHWLIAACWVAAEATALNLLNPAMASFGKLLFAVPAFFALHVVLYQSSRLFHLYIAVIFYAALCCIDNIFATFLFLRLNAPSAPDVSSWIAYPFVIHCVGIAVFYLYQKTRRRKAVGAADWKWYTAPAVLSLVSVCLINFFGSCFQSGQMAALPLFVTACFIAFLQMAAIFLISRMEQDARLREEALSLRAKAQAQQESIEALSAAYAQQRKLTHDFQAHLDTLSALLEQENIETTAVQKYVHDLRAAQTDRILLVSTRHTVLDALLNQKAVLAKKNEIDIQFSVNDLSAVKINEMHLTVLISNTLDNAMEACEKLPIHDRQIFVQVHLEDDVLLYSVRNRSLPVTIPPSRLPPTTKVPPTFHGYGLQNVQSILEKYDALHALYYEDGWFGFATELPNTLIS